MGAAKKLRLYLQEAYAFHRPKQTGSPNEGLPHMHVFLPAPKSSFQAMKPRLIITHDILMEKKAGSL